MEHHNDKMNLLWLWDQSERAYRTRVAVVHTLVFSKDTLPIVKNTKS